MKRFYKDATVGRAENGGSSDTVDGGFVVLLDGRSIKTPAKNGLVVTSKIVAEAIAQEWQAQGEKIDPATMPMMRFAATAIDRITTQRKAVIAEISAFGGHDMLCYRGVEPELAALQASLWQPLLDWASNTLGAKLEVTSGISSIDQDASALAILEKCVCECSDMELSALHTITSITGSLIIALALTRGEIDVDKAWEATVVDERFQEIVWGRDAEAEDRLIARQQSMVDGARFFTLCTDA
ncbi:MAG: ATPase [Alphaproteobacteria bacterium]|jgi:chaperone required for assembly of F1-ATPase|nr:ATPase [Alphaproteobacteria bacterium]MBT4965814.1 ATPase [Alphaproteobacteria bacterium]MBT5158956.1 ATPase [Alphaproteobacteria bacterium]MBT5919360.1 ATPase [Alphaproteobacteria bacterium]MBT6385123.1 ATPase [Alphaproteobacteria bacterium]